MAPTATDQQLAAEIHELRRDFQDFRVDVAEKLGSIEVNIVEKLAAIQSSLEGFRGRTETSFRIAVWGIGIASVVALSVIGSIVTVTWYAAKLDSRVQQLETHAPAVPGVKGAR